MLLYAHGDGLKAQKDATFELTFAGNLGQELYTNTSHPLRVDVGLVGMSVEKSRALEVISFIDVGCCCLWVLVCLWMVKQITTIQEEVDDKTTTISDYSVQVTNPPADVTENELEVRRGPPASPPSLPHPPIPRGRSPADDGGGACARRSTSRSTGTWWTPCWAWKTPS